MGGSKEVAAVARPTGYAVSMLDFTWDWHVKCGGIVPQRLDLSRVALQLARHAIGLDIEDHHCTIHLESVLVFWVVLYLCVDLGFTNSSRGKVVAFVVEA